MQLKCAVCGIKKLRFVKAQEAKGLLSNLKHHWIKFHYWVIYCFNCIKINEIGNKFLLAGDKFMPEMHLKQAGFAYSVCGSFN